MWIPGVGQVNILEIVVGQKHYAMPVFLSLGIFYIQRLITGEVFMEASRTTSFDEYKVQNTSVIISKGLLWKKMWNKVISSSSYYCYCGLIPTLCQRRQLSIYVESLKFVHVCNHKMSVVECQQNETLWRTKRVPTKVLCIGRM